MSDNNNNNIKAAVIDQSNASKVANNVSTNENVIDPVAPLSGAKAAESKNGAIDTYIDEETLKRILQGVTPLSGNDFNARMINTYTKEVGPKRLEKMFKWIADGKEVLNRQKNITKYNLSTITNSNRSATGFVETFDSRTYESEDNDNEYGSPLTTTCDQDHTLVRMRYENSDGALTGASVGFPVVHKTIDQLLVSRLTDSMGKQSPIDGKVFDVRSLINANVLPVIKNGSVTHSHRVLETFLQIIARAFGKPMEHGAGYDKCQFQFYDIYDLPRASVQKDLTTDIPFDHNTTGSATIVCDSLNPYDILNDLILYGVGFTHLFRSDGPYNTERKRLKIYVNSCGADLSNLSKVVDITTNAKNRVAYYGNKPEYVCHTVVPFEIFFDQLISGSRFVGPNSDRLPFVQDNPNNHNQCQAKAVGTWKLRNYGNASWDELGLAEATTLMEYLISQWKNADWTQWDNIKNGNNFYIPRYVLNKHENYNSTTSGHTNDNYVTFTVYDYNMVLQNVAPGNVNSVVKCYNVNDYLAAIHAFTKAWYFQKPVHLNNKVYSLDCSMELTGPGLYRDNSDGEDVLHFYTPPISIDQSSIWSRIGMFYGQLDYIDKHMVTLDDKVTLRNKMSNYAKYLSGSFCHLAKELYGSVYEMNRKMPQLLRMKLARVQDILSYQHDVDIPLSIKIPSMMRYLPEDYDYNDPILQCGYYDNQTDWTNRQNNYYLVEYYNLAEWWRYDYFDGPWYDAPTQMVCPNNLDQEYSQKDDAVFLNRDQLVGHMYARFTPNGVFSTFNIRTVLTWDSENSVFYFKIPKLFKNPKVIESMRLHGYDLWGEMTPEWVVPYGYNRGFIDAGQFTEEIADSLF